jgi:diguanylate cyclase (GGDEF)-like protein/PAS domain S-box-containing protein
MPPPSAVSRLGHEDTCVWGLGPRRPLLIGTWRCRFQSTLTNSGGFARARQMQAVADLGLEALADPAFPVLIGRAVGVVARELDVEVVAIDELLADGQLLVRAAVGLEEGAAGHYMAKGGDDSQAGYTLLAGEPVIADDLRQEVRFTPAPALMRAGARSSISVAIGPRERSWGVLVVAATRTRRFSDDDIVFLQSMANVLGAAAQRVEAENALRVSEELFRGGFEHSPIGMALSNLEGTLRQANAAFVRMLGYERPEELAGASIASFTHPEDRWKDSDAIRAMLEEGLPYSGEKRYIDARGAVVDALVVSTPVRDEHGQPSAFFTQVEDITEAKRAQARVREGQSRLQGIIDHAATVIYLADADGRYMLINNECERVLGVSREQAVGRLRQDVLPGEIAAQHRANDLEILRRGHAITFEETAPGEDGERSYLSVKFPLREEHGQIYAVGGISTDITERKIAERERARVLEELHASEQLFATGFEESPIGMALTRRDGELERVNDTFARPLGYRSPDQLAGVRWETLVHPDDAAASRAALISVLESGRRHLGELRCVDTDGGVIHAVVATTLVRDTREQPSILFTQVLDITDRVRAGRALAESDANYRRILETTLEGVWTLDSKLVTTFVNPAMAEMLGCEPRDVICRPVSDFIEPAAADQLRERVARRERVGAQRELVLRGPHGREVWALVSANPLYDGDGAYAGALAMITDITERRKMEVRLQHLADRDPLTGIYNRRRLIEELDRQLRHAARSRRSGARLAFDVDHLKVINDTHGHAAGDAILRAVTEALNARTRETDVVARLGGDEFAVILPEATEHEAGIVARDIRELLCESQLGPAIMTSVGIVMLSGHEEITADEILVCADTALYEAKERGGDQARVYSGQASGALTWVQRIHTALAEDRFVLFGQPIIDLRTGQVSHHELLIRMVSEDGELIAPGRFIPTAERFGLIHEIDRWVTTAGLRVARAGAGVAINLSGSSIGEQAIIGAVRAGIADGLDPANVIFEITETAAMSNITAARLFAGNLAGFGCGVALDDFGTGFGSFTYLKHIPARYLKIDIEFIRDLATSDTDQQVVRSIVGVAHSLGKLTIAEGVEDADALAILREYGVEYAQGFHFGRPKPLGSPKSQS